MMISEQMAIGIAAEWKADPHRVFNTFGRMCLEEPYLAQIVFALAAGKVENLAAAIAVYDAMERGK